MNSGHLSKSPPVKQPAGNLIKKIRFHGDDEDSICKEKEKAKDFSKERLFKLNKPATELDSICSTQSTKGQPGYVKKGVKGLSFGGSQVQEYSTDKTTIEKPSSLAKTPRYTPAKTFATPRRQSVPTKIIHTGPNREVVSC